MNRFIADLHRNGATRLPAEAGKDATGRTVGEEISQPV